MVYRTENGSQKIPSSLWVLIDKKRVEKSPFLGDIDRSKSIFALSAKIARLSSKTIGKIGFLRVRGRERRLFHDG